MVLPKILVLIRNPIFDRRPRPVRSSASRSAVVLFSMRETRRALCRAFCKMPHVHCFVCKRNTKEAVALSPCRLPSLSSSLSRHAHTKARAHKSKAMQRSNLVLYGFRWYFAISLKSGQVVKPGTIQGAQTQKPPTAIRHPTLCATLRARTPALPYGSAGSQCGAQCGMMDRCGGFLRL